MLSRIASVIGVVLAGASLATCQGEDRAASALTRNWIWNVDWIRAVA